MIAENYNMWDWFHRWRQRERDLEQGVDADLVLANRRRWKLCAWLFGISFLSLGIRALAKFQGTLNKIATAIAVLLFFSAMILGHWARSWDAFLGKPDPKEPPRLWRWRR
jgi:hypothetical protein